MPPKHIRGSGWTVELVKSAFERGAKIEPFNAAYVKLHMKRPEVEPKQLTDFAMPIFNGASLVPIAIVNEAVPGWSAAPSVPTDTPQRRRPKP